jgi:hypothetical protein
MNSEKEDYMAQGYIYILVNPSLKKSLLKIGRTSRDPEIRSDEISQGTGIPMPYYVAYSHKVLDCEHAEKLVHEKLESCRINDSREFFELPLSEAISTITQVAESINSPEILWQKAQDRIEKEEYESAYPYLLRLSDLGDSKAKFVVWDLAQEGWGDMGEFDDYVKYLFASADQGYAPAELVLAEYHAEDIVFKGDNASKAVYWGKRAVEHGAIEAATIVGNMYAVEHKDLKKNDEKALYWFKKSAEVGDAYAQFQVGVSYLAGLGVPKNIDIARKWFEKARDSGYEIPEDIERDLI